MNRDVQTDAMRAEMFTQIDPIRKIKDIQVGCTPMESQSTQTESRIEEIKIQRLVEHSNLEQALEKESDEPLTET